MASMKLPQLKFELLKGINPKKAEADILEEIKKNEMAPYYEQLCAESVLKKEQSLLSELSKKNEAELQKLKEKLEDAEKNFGETEVQDALVQTAEYLAKIGDKEKALSAFRQAAEKAVGSGAKLDLCFAQFRLGLFFEDWEIVKRQTEKAKSLIEEGGDWDRRNRLKVYEGISLLSIRDFKTATPLLIDGLATFTSTELMEYKDFVKYVALAAVLVLPRDELKKKIIESPEVLEVIHQIPHMESFVNSLYNCEYGTFFQNLASVESIMKGDRYLNAHYAWYVREMRIRAYAQLLESYRSVTLESMSKQFGVTEEYLDKDLCKFIAAGRLHCVIDKVSNLVETNRPDTKNAQYQSVIKQGDLLLNRIQKLSRVINV